MEKFNMFEGLEVPRILGVLDYNPTPYQGCSNVVNTKNTEGCYGITCLGCIMYEGNHEARLRYLATLKEPVYKYRIEAKNTVVGTDYKGDGSGDMYRRIQPAITLNQKPYYFANLTNSLLCIDDDNFTISLLSSTPPPCTVADLKDLELCKITDKVDKESVIYRRVKTSYDGQNGRINMRIESDNHHTDCDLNTPCERIE